MVVDFLLVMHRSRLMVAQAVEAMEELEVREELNMVEQVVLPMAIRAIPY